MHVFLLWLIREIWILSGPPESHASIYFVILEPTLIKMWDNWIIKRTSYLNHQVAVTVIAKTDQAVVARVFKSHLWLQKFLHVSIYTDLLQQSFGKKHKIRNKPIVLWIRSCIILTFRGSYWNAISNKNSNLINSIQ